jgi:hypothetical protein
MTCYRRVGREMYVSGFLLLSACVAQPPAPTAWVAPFDGQTAVASDFAPTIDIALDAPEGWPLDLDVIRVVDLGTGAPVPGLVEADATAIWFTPDQPWADDADFAWSVDAPAEQPRGPSSVFPPVVVGTASFSTRGDLELVAVGTLDDERVCALWSRPADLAEINEWTPTIDGEPAGPWEETRLDDPASERGLAGPALACVPGLGATLRIEDADGIVASRPIRATHPDDLVKELRRWSP